MVCLRTVAYSVVINGKPSRPFEAKSGLRQGDPMSPFLFVLAMEYFSRLLKTLKATPEFRYHPRCAKMQLVQLGFGDDLLLLCFQEFLEASRLIANSTKNSVYFGGVYPTVQQQILEVLGFTEGDLPLSILECHLAPRGYQ